MWDVSLKESRSMTRGVRVRRTRNFTYKKPFDVIAKGIFKNWRPQRDLNPCYRLERAMS